MLLCSNDTSSLFSTSWSTQKVDDGMVLKLSRYAHYAGRRNPFGIAEDMGPVFFPRVLYSGGCDGSNGVSHQHSIATVNCRAFSEISEAPNPTYVVATNLP
jgi:hypothetical protein